LKGKVFWQKKSDLGQRERDFLTIFDKNMASELKYHRETFVDQIVQLMEKSILSGEVAPKTGLSEAIVAQQFGVSRGPAREALQRLEEMNLVKMTRLGREVKEFSPDELHDIYELKNVVEAYGVMQGSLRATEKDHKEIASLLNKMANKSDYESIEKLSKINYEFHDRMVWCSRNKKLVELHNSLVKQVRWAISLSLQLEDRSKLSFEEHQKIFDAFVSRDAVKARILMEKHTSRAMKRVLAKLKDKKQYDL
jgi:DNA-binding GntR family transcriptional regulator